MLIAKMVSLDILKFEVSCLRLRIADIVLCSSFSSVIIETDRMSANQSELNVFIKTLATKIPEHLYYTALPQLISRVVHQNPETSNNVALIIRNVLAKYPRQSMWSCGWLRFSKSKDKKKAGDVSFALLGGTFCLRSL